MTHHRFTPTWGDPGELLTYLTLSINRDFLSYNLVNRKLKMSSQLLKRTPVIDGT